MKSRSRGGGESRRRGVEESGRGGWRRLPRQAGDRQSGVGGARLAVGKRAEDRLRVPVGASDDYEVGVPSALLGCRLGSPLASSPAVSSTTGVVPALRAVWTTPPFS